MKLFKKGINPDRDPSTAYIKLDNVVLKAEKDLTEKYQAFSAELLRISLLGIAVIGFIYVEVLKTLPTVSKHAAARSAFCFGASAVCAILHRYLSSETLRYYIWGSRWESRFQNSQALEDQSNARHCLTLRYNFMVGCVISKFLSVCTLATGAGLLAYAFIVPLLQ